jgi:hypothetical protein
VDQKWSGHFARSGKRKGIRPILVFRHRECPKKFQGVKCHGCRKFGHIVKDCQSKGKMQFKVKVRSMNNEEAITMIEEAKEDFLEGLK